MLDRRGAALGATPITVVTIHDRFNVRFEDTDLERPGTDGFQRRAEAIALDGRGADHHTGLAAQQIRHLPVRTFEFQSHGMLVGGFHRYDLSHRFRHRETGTQTEFGAALKIARHCRRVERRAIVKQHALTEVQHNLGQVGVIFPGFRQSRCRLPGIVQRN